jgi:O-antigen/teichoic acid export membrane protein
MTQGDSVARGAAFTLAARWTDRLIGLVSTVILARLLVPADFGIIAMASLVIALVDVFLDLGVTIALIQRSELTQAHYDSAFTLRLAQTAIATLVVVVSAPLAAAYFKDARIEPVLQLLGFSLLLSGLENIGVVQFQKEMRFGRDFQFAFTKRVAGFIATVVAAWFMRSYWALVVGTLAGRTFGVVASYFIHPMRPRLTLAKARDIFSVSQWTLIRGIGGFVDQNLHKWVVGGRVSAAVMGGYSLADDMAFLPASMLLIPLNRVLFPAFARAKDDPVELKRMYLLAQGVQAIVGIPSAVGLMLVADEAVRVLFGEKWAMAVPFLRLLALVGVASAIMTSAGYVMIALGRFKELAVFSWIRVILFAIVAYGLLGHIDALGVATLRALFIVVSLALFGGWLHRSLPQLRLRDIVSAVGRPLLAAVGMSACVWGVGALVGDLSLVGMLLVKIATGIASYATLIALLWWAAGRPRGAEAYLLQKVGLIR